MFHAANILDQEHVSEQLVGRMLATVLRMMDRYVPGFMSVIFANESPKEAIHALRRRERPGRVGPATCGVRRWSLGVRPPRDRRRRALTTCTRRSPIARTPRTARPACRTGCPWPIVFPRIRRQGCRRDALVGWSVEVVGSKWRPFDDVACQKNMA